MSKWKWITFLSCVGVVLGLTSCMSAPVEPYYQRSQLVPFDFQANAPFSEYVQHIRQQLREQRVFFDPQQKKNELDRVAPFELRPSPNCSTQPTQGILLIHGLLDTPYAMKDLAPFFQERCFLVRSVLLPGHGTRPADLIDVSYGQWREAVDYGVRILQQEVNSVYVAGYSLGGALATHMALDHPDLKGIILLAPAWEVAFPWLAWQSKWLRHLQDWVDVDPHTIPVRYQSMATNAIAQTYATKEELQERLDETDSWNFPVFMALSIDDLSIQSDTVIELFQEHNAHPKSRVLLYGKPQEPITDSRIQVIHSYMPEQKIYNFSHVAIPYAPSNPVFGEAGSHKECGLYIGVVSQEESAACMAQDNNWKGEVNTNDEAHYPLQRLTYNPLFNEMMQSIEQFVNSLEE